MSRDERIFTVYTKPSEKLCEKHFGLDTGDGKNVDKGEAVGYFSTIYTGFSYIFG